jgi:hypothetical protein
MCSISVYIGKFKNIIPYIFISNLENYIFNKFNGASGA